MHQQKGFAISIDALLATVLTIGVISFIGFGMQAGNEAIMPAEINIKQAVDDTFTVLENNGMIAAKLVDQPDQDPAESILNAAQKLIPKNAGLRLEIKEFEANLEGESNCKETKAFEDCFVEKDGSFVAGGGVPTDREVFHGRIISMKKSLGLEEGKQDCEILPAAKLEEKKEKKAMLEEPELEKEVSTQVIVTDTNGGQLQALECDQEARVTLKMKDNSRQPIAVVLTMDRSGSMGTYDMNPKATATGTFNNGTCQSYPVWVPGKVGNALNFNGIYSYVTINGNVPSLQLTGDLTIEFWAKSTNVSTPNRQNPICKSYGGEFCLTMEPNGTLSYFHGSAGRDTSPYMSASADNIFTNNNWVHVVIVRNNAARTITFYKNGVAVSSSTSGWTSSTDPVTSIYPLRIGWQYTNVFNGIIDEVRIYNRQLSAGDIDQSYQLGLNGQPSNITNGLVGYWAFNESGGSTATDSSGTGNNGTLRGFYPAGSACQYNTGAGSYWQTNTNCPSSKSLVALHTNQKTALTYDIGSIRPYLGSSDYLEFLASPSCSSSLCTSMRLWIKRPDGGIESNWSDYYEDVYNPAQYAGNNYDINVWSAGNCNYYIYLRQKLATSNVSGSLLGSGTYDGQYSPACSCNWNGSNCVHNCTSPPYLSCSIGSVTCNGGTPCSWNGEACSYSWPDAPPSIACSGGPSCSFGSPCIWNGSACVYSKAPATPQTACSIGSVSCNGGSRGAVYCSNFENWQKVSEYNFSPAYDKLFYMYWNIAYNTYSMPPGSCYAPKFQIRHVNESGINDFNWPATTGTTGYCGSGGNGSCNITIANNNPISGPFAPSGKYELWGWSDTPLSLVRAYIYAYQSWGIIFGNLSRTDSISGGTCSGTACYYSSKFFPGTPTVTNCPSMSESLSRVASLPLADWKVVDSLSVPPNLKKAKVSMSYWGYAGGCNGGALGFQNPISGSNVFNWWYVWPRKNQTYSGCFSVNDSSTGCSNWDSGTTMPAGDYNVLGWADETTNYSITWYIKRIDAAINAANLFIDNTTWKTQDEIGLVSFSISTALNQGLTTDANLVKNALNGLAPAGETAIADAIDAATAELVDNAKSNAGRFLVLLTDGKANICLNGKSCPEAEAAAEAVTAANQARENGITIYVIGFANASIIPYEETLKKIAKDSNTDYCNDSEHCGKYYFAANQGELESIYDLVRGEIQATFGLTDIEVPFRAGMKLVDEDKILSGLEKAGKTGAWDDLTGTWQDTPSDDLEWNQTTGTLSARKKIIHYIADNLWFAMQFDVVLPCDGSYCSLDYVLFPSEATEIIDEDNSFVYWSEALEPATEQPCNDNYLKLPFKFKDLGINFESGKIEGGKILLDLNVANNGHIPAGLTLGKPLKINFFKEDGITQIGSVQCGPGDCILEPSKVNMGQPYNTIKLGGTAEPGSLILYGITLCASKPDASACSYGEFEDTETTIGNIAIPESEEGILIAKIDPDSILQCSENDIARIYCGKQKFRFFTIDYYSWVK